MDYMNLYETSQTEESMSTSFLVEILYSLHLISD